MKKINSTFDELTVAKKSVCQTISPINLFIVTNVFLLVGMLHGCMVQSPSN
jgi:hypothetical protein